MNAANWSNRTLWTGDNLDIMRGMNSESVDLIYLDPPFNSNRDYAAPIGSEAAGAAFKDTWTLSDVDEAWHGEIADRQPALYAILDAAGMAHGKGMKSYLIMMAVRLLEMQRLLKATGSIYLHCDPTASHYLKMLMDSIFGGRNFRNDISWKRKAGRGETQNVAVRFGVTSDVLLFYAKSPVTTLNRQYRESDPAYIKSKFNKVNEQGRRYQLDNLTSPSPRPNLMYEYKGYQPPKNGWAVSRERMEQMDREGRIHFPDDKSKRLRRIRYLDELPGETVDSLWDDIAPINSRAQERLGYPTQKPIALLDRIIRASSNENDVVLDPFCGCATALVAADRLDRQWAGIDLSPLAARLVLKRLRDDRGPLFDVVA
ncbi:MAG: site-specific DNA-methyltransferase, partial [Boseongicola sp. SB0675_bin_26]|nr:site-specific DNA-methyltransferase [Boseongicola sp. SB0675_bin_26]